MDCPDDNVLVALFDKQLTSKERDALEAHVDTCDACRRLVATVARSEPGTAGGRAPSSSFPPAPSGRYELRSVLGTGGMGVVYAAYDPVLDREVAIKLLRASDDTGPAERSDEARIVREARALARVTHPNVLSVYDAGVMDGQVFLAMERVHGVTLRAWALKERPSWERALRALIAAGRGLAAAHDAGLVHRDFKPDNVLIGNDDRVLVADFGLTRFHADAHAVVATPASSAADDDAITRAGAIPGTRAYMAPELFAGAAADARSDVYAYAVTAHEILFGARPGVGGATPPRTRDAPRSVRAAILCALDPSPAARPRSMHALVEQLEAALVAQRGSRLRATSGRLASVAFAVTVLGLVAGIWRHAATPEAAAPPARAKVTMTEFADDVGGAPAALAAYRAGLESLRGASNLSAIASLDRALVLDPSIGAAHVRLIYFASASPDAEEVRAHYKAAFDRRSTLSDRDRGLLLALEPLTREPPDTAERVRRMDALALRFAEDAELQWYRGEALLDFGDKTRAIAAFDRALVLDPEFALAYWGKAAAERFATGAEAAIAELDRCVAVSPGAASCLRVRGAILAQSGRCGEFLRDARRVVEVEPGGEGAYAMLARALAGSGAPYAAVEQALQQRWALVSERERPVVRGRDLIRLAILRGDFTSADQLADDLDRTIAGVSAERPHGEVVALRLDVYAETGDVARAAQVADAFLAKRRAWSSPLGDDPEDLVRTPIARAWRAAVQGGTLKPADAARARAAWLAEWRERLTPRDRRYLWFVTHALTAESAADAEDALRALPDFLATPPDAATFDSGALDIARGTVEALVGHTDRALVLLRRGVAACIALEDPALQTRAWLTLARALESARDRDGACRAYAEVLARWGDARPGSRSADAARARSGTLGCPTAGDP